MSKIFTFTKSSLLLLLLFAGCLHQKKHHQKLQDAAALAQYEAFFDVRPTDQHVSYIYAPGLMCSELIMARYCPQFTAATGEKVIGTSGGYVIGQPHSAVVFPEINLRRSNSFTLNPMTAYINRLRQDLFPLAQRWTAETYGITVQEKGHSSKTVGNYSINFSQINIGQKADIKALERTYRHHVKEYPQSEIVLYGDSRGAATIFNFIAQYNPPQVKAAVLEGIFDDIPHLIKHLIYTDKELRTEQGMLRILKLMASKYNKKGPFPRDFVEIITDDIPLLFVTSLKDHLCAPQGAFYLYNTLKARGHQNVHLLVLKNSLHPTYMLGKDKEMYENVVHAFYRHYHLPYNNQRATAGQALFMLTQPLEVTAKQYQLPECSACFITRQHSK